MISARCPRESNPRQPKPQSEADASGVTDLDEAYLSIGRDNETGRHCMHAPCAGEHAVLIVHHRKVDSLFMHVPGNFFRRGALHCDGDDVRIILREGGDGTLLGTADRAPGRPEVNQHGLLGACCQSVGLIRECETPQSGYCAADHITLLPEAYARNENHEHQHVDGIAPPFCRTRISLSW